MKQSEFIDRLFDSKPIVLHEPVEKFEWKNGERRETLPAIVKCGHCGIGMSVEGVRSRLISGATCIDCLERKREVSRQARL